MDLFIYLHVFNQFHQFTVFVLHVHVFYVLHCSIAFICRSLGDNKNLTLNLDLEEAQIVMAKDASFNSDHYRHLVAKLMRSCQNPS